MASEIGMDGKGSGTCIDAASVPAGDPLCKRWLKRKAENGSG